jgi:hypothetical protein
MKKQLLNEINEMKYLFGYKRGVVISEQSTTTGPPGPDWIKISPSQSFRDKKIADGYKVEKGSDGNWYSTTTPVTPATPPTNTTTATPPSPAPATPPSTSTQQTDDADYSKIVKYYSDNTDADWTFVSAGTKDYSGVIYDYIMVKTKDTAKNGNDCSMSLYDDRDAYKDNCKKSKVINGEWSWDGAKPTFTWEDRITKSSPGYVSDTDADFSAVTNDNKIMGLGAKGSLVKKVQNFLASNGYTDETFTNDIQACATDENSCDGIYGAKTKKMVKKFQEDAEIKPDGIFGTQTYDAMFGRS